MKYLQSKSLLVCNKLELRCIVITQFMRVVSYILIAKSENIRGNAQLEWSIQYIDNLLRVPDF